MLKLKEETVGCLKYIAENGCGFNTCEGCPLNMFNNESMSCQDIAKEVLNIIRIQEYLKPVIYQTNYSDKTLKSWTKEDLIEYAQTQHYNFVQVENAFEKQSDIFIKFFTENKGKIKVTLEYKEGKNE